MTKFDAYHNGKKLTKSDRLSNGLIFDHVTDDNKIATRGGATWEPGQVFCELKRFAGTIDMTPTWRAILPIILIGLENGNEDGRKIAMQELYRLADIADAYNASVKE